MDGWMEGREEGRSVANSKLLLYATSSVGIYILSIL
jgi:hypothetical protein